MTQKRASRGPRFLDSIGPGYSYEVASRREDLEQAYKLLLETYVRVGLCSPLPHKMLITNFNALPSTFVLVARHKGRVQAAVTVTVATGFGLPCFEAFPAIVSNPDYQHMAEISLVAISEQVDKEYAEAAYLWPLWNYVLRFCRYQLKIRAIISAVTDASARSLVMQLGLKQMGRLPITNNQQKKQNLHLLGESLSVLQQKWLNIDLSTDHRFGYTSFFVDNKYPEFLFLKIPAGLREVLTIKPDDFVYFFLEKTKIAECLPHALLTHLRSVYEESQFSNFGRTFFPPLTENRSKSGLRRYNYRLNGCLETETNEKVRISLSQISEGGFRATADKALRTSRGKTWEVVIQLTPRQLARLTVTSVWRRDRTMGFRILNAPREWHALVQAAAVHTDGHRGRRSQANPFENISLRNTLRESSLQDHPAQSVKSHTNAS